MIVLCKRLAVWFSKKAFSPKSCEEDPTQGQAQNASERDHQYTLVIRDYVEHQRKVNTAQRWFKAIFFLMVCGVFVGIVVACLYIMVQMARRPKTDWNDFAVVLASVVSLISVVIVLPGKIAEHLFPNGGDKDITDFIINMHKSDRRKLGDAWGPEQATQQQEEASPEKATPQS